MKLVYPEIDTIFDFNCGFFPAAVIENRGLFYRFVDDLQRQCCGDDGSSVLSEDDTPVSIAGNLELITQFFPFEINRKTLLNKVLARLEKHAVAPEFYERSQQLLSNLEKMIYETPEIIMKNLCVNRYTRCGIYHHRCKSERSP